MPHPRSFYRTRRFWLGLPVLLFLIWAWWDSTRFMSVLYFQLPGYSCNLVSLKGSAGCTCNRNQSPSRMDSWQFHHTPLSEVRYVLRNNSFFPRYFSSHGNRFGVAYWFIITLYGTAWLGTSLLWNRRKVRLMSTPVTVS